MGTYTISRNGILVHHWRWVRKQCELISGDGVHIPLQRRLCISCPEMMYIPCPDMVYIPCLEMGTFTISGEGYAYHVQRCICVPSPFMVCTPSPEMVCTPTPEVVCTPSLEG